MTMDGLRVFHPTELTPECTQAFCHAVRVAVMGNNTLTLMHVREWGDDEVDEKFPSPEELLERWAIEGTSLEVERVRSRGEDVVRELLGYLDLQPVHLLVLPTRGRKGFDAWFSGSVAEPVARLSKAMTLFVRHGCRGFVDEATGAVSLDHILVPVTRTPSPEPALQGALDLAATLGASEARITTCYVGDPADAPLVGDHPLVIRQGPPAEAITALARELRADLIAMTTEGRQGVLDALRGSTTERVVRDAPCPVLAVPTAR